DIMPKAGSWIIIAIGLYVTPGPVMYANRISFKNIWDKIIYTILTTQLFGAALLHVYILIKENTDVLHSYPHKYWYSFIAIAYFVAMMVYVVRLNRKWYTKFL
ncbi:MAG: hypothetical protein ACI8SE_001834, partial [Bacteroidia bacterium]